MRLFISYARIDKPFCIQFVNILDVHEVWYDQRLYAGQHWWKEILRRLDWCEGFIYLLSPDSSASEYCLKELEIAQRLGRVVIPVLIHDETEIPTALAHLQYVEMLRGLTAENVKAVLNAIYLVEHPRKNSATEVSRVENIDNHTRSSPVSKSAKIVGMAASALENAEYDRAVFLLRQAKEGGFQSRFINIDRLLEEAELALETLSREREAKREYEQILELFHYQRTRNMACEAFLQFQIAFPDYDPQNLKAECLSMKGSFSAKQVTQIEVLPQPDVGLPLLEWCEIPAGSVYVEDPRNHQDKRWTLESFEMSKYPVTNAQFACFMSDSSGYCNPRWWQFSKVAGRWLQDHPEPLEPHFSGDDRPRETVNWYEAVAFSNWLGHRLNATISLPTLAQWQRAAFGDDDRLYPWGNHFNPETCNTRENGLKMTTSVKRYSAGASPYDVYDMAGNVWEWCLDKLEPEEGGLDYRRAVIGGSFVSPCDRAQSSFRYFLNPEARYSSIGFRILRLPKSANLAR
jgi:formylglycine-generating enzyme required for sulfatase activity